MHEFIQPFHTFMFSSAIAFGPRSSKTSFMDAPTVNSNRNGSDPLAILNLPKEDVNVKFNKYIPTLEMLDSHAQDHPSLYTGSSISDGKTNKKVGNGINNNINSNNSSTSNDELSDASAGAGTISEIIDLVAAAATSNTSSTVQRKRTTTEDSDQTITRVAYDDILDDYCGVFDKVPKTLNKVFTYCA
jgi:hypothetical protein